MNNESKQTEIVDKPTKNYHPYYSELIDEAIRRGFKIKYA